MARVYHRNMKSNKEYSIADLIRMNAFPWTDKMSERKKYREYGKIIRKDFLGANILQAVITGAGRSAGYRIGSKNIKSFVGKYGPGLSLAAKNRRKPKPIWTKKSTEN